MWWKPSKPEEIKSMPWLAPRVVEYLESILRPEFTVIEHGSGGSTLWFAERVQNVTVYENNLEWAIAVDGEKDNIYVRYNDVPYSKHRFYDLLFIDGEPVADRAKWIASAPDFVKPGGWVVLDNANRPEYAKERKGLQDIAESYKTFDCNESTAYLVTEFYKMKG